MSQGDSANLGSLLRFFRSEFFDAWIAVSYLYKYSHTGIHDYLVNELWKFPDEVIEFYLPQLCHLMIHRLVGDSIALRRFLVTKCSQSMHFAFKVFWLYQAAIEDDLGHFEHVVGLQQEIENAAINGPKSYQASQFHSHEMTAPSKELIALRAKVEKQKRKEKKKKKKILISRDEINQPVGQGSRFKSTTGFVPPSPELLAAAEEAARASKEEKDKDGEGASESQEGKKDDESATAPADAVVTDIVEEAISSVGGDAAPQDEKDSTDDVSKDEPKEEDTSKEDASTDKTEEKAEKSEDKAEEKSEEKTEDKAEEKTEEKTEDKGEDSKEPVTDSPPDSREVNTAPEDGDALDDDDDDDDDDSTSSNQQYDKCFSEEHMAEVLEGMELRSETSGAKLETDHFLSKGMRCEYFTSELKFTDELCNISTRLRSCFPPELRTPKLRVELERVNQNLPPSVHLPHFRANERHHRIVRLVAEESVVLSSAERTPYMVHIEVLLRDETCASPTIHHALADLPFSGAHHLARSNSDLNRYKPSTPQERATRRRSTLIAPDDGEGEQTTRSSFGAGTHAHDDDLEDEEEVVEEEAGQTDTSAVLNTSTAGPGTPATRDQLAPTLSAQSAPAAIAGGTEGQESEHPPLEPTGPIHEVTGDDGDEDPLGATTPTRKHSGAEGEGEDEWVDVPDTRTAGAATPYGEYWADKAARIRAASAYGHLPTWRLFSVIVKSGDDCRQEHLAMQLVEKFQQIFKEANIPVWLRPYKVLVSASDCAFIETIPDSLSLSALKKRSINFTTLKQHFEDMYGPENSPSFRQAQANFVESCAGYSILCYLLQVKDRHNGNIMIDAQGHIIHIDFGFMLSTSPGSINFESAPFKLAAEFVEVMGGESSDMFQYFRMLCSRAFLEARKNFDKLILLVRMLASGETNMPCLQYGDRVVEEFKSRFRLELNEDEACTFVDSLIEQSKDNWRTRQYDKFQRYTQGIL